MAGSALDSTAPADCEAGGRGGLLPLSGSGRLLVERTAKSPYLILPFLRLDARFKARGARRLHGVAYTNIPERENPGFARSVVVRAPPWAAYSFDSDFTSPSADAAGGESARPTPRRGPGRGMFARR